MTPPTFPMRPLNGGNLTKPFAIIPPWARAYEPKANGWRLTVHAPTGSCFNRHNEPLTIAAEFAESLASLKTSPFTWLDCEGLSRRHAIGKGSLIVLDIIDLHAITYTERRKVLCQAFPNRITHADMVASNRVYHLPSFNITRLGGAKPRFGWPKTVWHLLQAQNQEMGLTGDNVFWEGFVAKRLDSTYHHQLADANRESAHWIKSRFI